MNTNESLSFIKSYIDLDASESEVYAQCDRLKRLLEQDNDPLDVDSLIADYIQTNYHK